MRLLVCLTGLLLISGCSDDAWAPMTFSCASSGEETADPGQDVLFHFAEGYLFIQNDRGGADNVCAQARTIDCAVTMTRNELTLRQTVEKPYCGFRSEAHTKLDIDRKSGAFRLLQEGCDPSEDIAITGVCHSVARPSS